MENNKFSIITMPRHSGETMSRKLLMEKNEKSFAEKKSHNDTADALCYGLKAKFTSFDETEWLE